MSSQEFVDKLDTLHKISTKTEDLANVTSQLRQEMAAMKQEEENMKEYNTELDLLTAEKLHHVEVLRQIHSDINMIETVIKQGKQVMADCRTKCVSLYNDYVPLKARVNDLRTELGLNSIEQSECDKYQFLAASLSNRQKASKRSAAADSAPEDGRSSKQRAGSKRPVSSTSHDKNLLSPDAKSTLPPMKQCASCHQNIHRNAPICPLCKAKSRSRNPKKTKK